MAKIKHAIRTLEPVLYLAGLFCQERDDQLHLMILTRPDYASIRYIHDRMPVIFSSAFHAPWLRRRTPVRVWSTRRLWKKHKVDGAGKIINDTKIQ